MHVPGSDVSSQECWNFFCDQTDLNCPPKGQPQCPGFDPTLKASEGWELESLFRDLRVISAHSRLLLYLPPYVTLSGPTNVTSSTRIPPRGMSLT